MRTTRPGSRLVSGRGVAIAVIAFILFGGGTEAAGSGKSKKEQPPYALVTGTVFRETGVALAGAQVTMAAVGDSKEARKAKKILAVTSPRGEFVIRVAAAPMCYTLSVKASGYQPREKPVAIAAEDRIDVFFRMEPASK